jgi:6-phosphogluconolactonase
MQHCLIGTYTIDTSAEGIYHVTESGTTRCVAKTLNPSYLAMHPLKPVIYCVNETDDFEPEDEGHTNQNRDTQPSVSGGVSAFCASNLDSQELTLDLLNQQLSMGADPCHLSLCNEGRFLVIANYSGGTFTTLPLDAAGYLESFQSLIEHKGSGPHPERQQSAHVHSSLLGKDQALFIADLGADRISRYQLNAAGRVTNERTHIAAKSGAGPRFMAQSEHQLFVLNELDNTLAAYSLDDLSLQQCISTVPNQDVENLGAHLVLSQDQRFLYVSNRGFDTLSVYRTGPQLELVQTISSGGDHPRHFALLANEAQLLVANMHSDNLVLFDRNSDTGELTTTGSTFQVPSPACVLPLPGAL